mmetsp:Transcript_2994/g.8658  ORF Transcript_2994/g.8658 Transcript_2994/m.8658 type:complete len:266 (+) Transcript_2994:300-1097(+)
MCLLAVSQCGEQHDGLTARRVEDRAQQLSQWRLVEGRLLPLAQGRQHIPQRVQASLDRAGCRSHEADDGRDVHEAERRLPTRRHMQDVDDVEDMAPRGLRIVGEPLKVTVGIPLEQQVIRIALGRSSLPQEAYEGRPLWTAGVVGGLDSDLPSPVRQQVDHAALVHLVERDGHLELVAVGSSGQGLEQHRDTPRDEAAVGEALRPTGHGEGLPRTRGAYGDEDATAAMVHRRVHGRLRHLLKDDVLHGLREKHLVESDALFEGLA